MKDKFQSSMPILVTAGSTYLDIDAYACMVATAELLNLKGENAIAYSSAPCNYSVCEFLVEKGQIVKEFPAGVSPEEAEYVIVDVSDPKFLKDSVPLDKIIKIYDHHVGFEEYWTSRIGDGAHIEFIGAAATLIYREWKKAGLQGEMQRSTALLLVAAILDNTLYLTASNTAEEDIAAFNALCEHAGVNDAWRASYFSEVQKNVEADLKNALFNDMKRIGQSTVLPAYMAQLCVWDAEGMLERLPDIRGWFDGMTGGWMLNLIDIKHHVGYFICDDLIRQKKIEEFFDVSFKSGVAKSAKPYLRKQMLKNVLNSK